MRYWIFLAILWPCFVIGQTHTGGLYHIRSPDLLIINQDIQISIAQIKVDYVISNATNDSIKEAYVFAMPNNNEDNFKQTTVLINQEPVNLQIIQRAISASGIDVSNNLKNLGIPFNPIAAMHSIDSSPNHESILNKLRTLKLVDLREDTPTWTVQTHAYFHYEFPALSTTNITLLYKPNVTSLNIKTNGLDNLINLPVKLVKKIYHITKSWRANNDATIIALQEQFEKYYPQINQFCPNKQDYQTLAKAYAQQTSKKPNLELKFLNFSYGDNNLLPETIKDFSVTVESTDKMHALLCWHGEQAHIDGNIKQFTAKNYIPSREINVLYIEK